MVELSELASYLEDNYRWFHRHPELAYAEYATTEHIKEMLAEHGIAVVDSGLGTGLVAEVRGTEAHVGSAPVVAIRGDIDALPLSEETGLPYTSQTPGVMHGCGHDVNLSVALGAAILLQNRRSEFSGTVKVIFQPAEEVRADKDHPTGAVAVLRTGVLDDVQAFFGTHDTDALPLGTVGISDGAVSGAVDKFEISVTGQGTHAAKPHEGVNPISVVAAIIGALQSVSGQNMDPTHAGVLTVTHVEAGSTWNIVPSTAFLEGTVRTAGTDDREMFRRRVHEIASGVAAAYGVTADVIWNAGCDSVLNDPTWSALARQVASDVGLSVGGNPVSLGGEDFSYYLADGIPGCFVHVGAASADFPAHVIHSPHFAPDPRAIIGGARFLAALAERALIRLGSQS